MWHEHIKFDPKKDKPRRATIWYKHRKPNPKIKSNLENKNQSEFSDDFIRNYILGHQISDFDLIERFEKTYETDDDLFRRAQKLEIRCFCEYLLGKLTREEATFIENALKEYKLNNHGETIATFKEVENLSRGNLINKIQEVSN
jgi:hypothetical protein